jgi:8-oxo-dGTP pyrophosphatase MutT (NUDIX family)
MRSHPGQVAFPGGKIDPGEDAVGAALREAHEELGIQARDVTVIGTSDTYRTGSGYAIVPVIAVVPPDIELKPSPTEVAAWFEAPVDFVFDPANHTSHSGFWQGRERSYIEIMWQQHRIWGVTAGIIANLSRRLAW